MSRRVLFIGNSHLAAVKVGWEQIKQTYSDVEADLFGSHRDTLKETALDGARIVPTAARIGLKFKMTGGAEAIDLALYERVFIIGSGFGIETFAEPYRTHGLWQSWQKRQDIISHACFQDSGRDLLDASPAMHIARLVGQARKIPVTIAVQPSPTMANGSIKRPSIVDDIAEAGDEEIYALFEAACLEIASDNLRIVPQPKHTRLRTVYTKPEYGEGSVRLSAAMDIPHPPVDRRHMNARYGIEVIAALLDPSNGHGHWISAPSRQAGRGEERRAPAPLTQ